MSIEAISWALGDAPDVPPQCVSLLIGLANHADSRGRGAYVGQKLLAGYARKSDRSVRNDLGTLLERGIIRLGDQALAGHIPADCRPVVYDLALERKQASGRKHSSARQQASAATSDRFSEDTPSDQGERKGSGSRLPAGNELPAGSEEQRERKPASYKPTTNQKQNSSTKSSTDVAGDAGALFDATPSKPSRSNGAAKHPPASRIPDDFAITPDMRDWAAKNIPDYGIDIETENFIDWWRAKPGAAATKTDWPATWRTWMRKNAREAPQSSRNGGKPASGPGKQTDYTDEEYSRGWK